MELDHYYWEITIQKQNKMWLWETFVDKILSGQSKLLRDCVYWKVPWKITLRTLLSQTGDPTDSNHSWTDRIRVGLDQSLILLGDDNWGRTNRLLRANRPQRFNCLVFLSRDLRGYNPSNYLLRPILIDVFLISCHGYLLSADSNDQEFLIILIS